MADEIMQSVFGAITVGTLTVDTIKLGDVTNYSQETHEVFTLLNNKTNEPVGGVLTFPKATWGCVVVEYELERTIAALPERQSGVVRIAQDTSEAEEGELSVTSDHDPVKLGVNWSADISGANCRLLYTTTNLGTDIAMQADVKFQLA